MAQSQLAWEQLLKAIGSYQGRGINHEKQNFVGALKVESALPSKVLAITSSAVGDNGETFHAEKSWVGFDMTGVLTLYVASSNHPAITPHLFNRVEEKPDQKNVIFRFGNLDDRQSFREEVTFSFYTDGSVAHHYSWGLPGGDFEPRSGSKMGRLS